MHGTGQPFEASTYQRICDDFARTLRDSPETPIQDFLDRVPSPNRDALLIELIAAHADFRRSLGESPSAEEYAQNFPEHASAIRTRISASSAIPDQGSTRLATHPADVGGQPRVESVDRYKFEYELGRGAFGQVWAAHDPVLDRKVAIKLLRFLPADDVAGVRELLDEGRRLANLDHEHIVRVLDAGVSEGRVYLVSELMTGETLAARLKEKQVSTELAVSWILKLARALQHAHDRGYVHRDIKPSNILFDAADEPHLSDFGLALSEAELQHETPGTVGTVSYMSPEQARGDSHLTDSRSDIFSLGIVLYRLLTGRLPSHGQTPEEYLQQIQLQPAGSLRSINPAIPADLEDICLRCLQINPDDRFQSAAELAEKLENWRSRSAKSSTRRTKLLAAAGLIAAAIFVTTSALDSKADRAVVLEPAGLLSQLSPVAWNPNDTSKSFRLHPESGHFLFDVNSPAAFRAGVSPDQRIDASALVAMPDGVGVAGLFWALHYDEKSTMQHCWAVTIGRPLEQSPMMLFIDEYEISDAPGGRRAVVGQNAAYEKIVEVPVTGPVRLRVQAEGSLLRQVWLNGKQMFDEPLLLRDENWGEMQRPEWGVCGRQGRIAILDASAQ